jgi:hypothetical protein
MRTGWDLLDCIIQRRKKNKMKFIDGVVFFKSTEPWYDKEKFGIKNNTVRILSENEFNSISWNSVVQIEISNPITEQCFRRDLTDISRIGRVCGNYIVVFTWKTEEKNG